MEIRSLWTPEQMVDLAIHEAGHVVVALAVGRHVESATIEASATYAGRTVYSNPLYGYDKRRRLQCKTTSYIRRSEAEAMISLAGAIAERWPARNTLLHYACTHGRSDLINAVQTLSYIRDKRRFQRTTNPLRRYLALTESRTRQILAEKENWRVLCGLAEALLTNGTINAAQIQHHAYRITPYHLFMR